MPDSRGSTGGDSRAPVRRRRRFVIVLGLLAIVLLAVVFALPRILDLDRYRGEIVSEIEKATGGKTTLGRLGWGISTGLWVEADGLSISEAPGFPVSISVGRVSVRLAIRPLLSKKIVVTRLLLDRPDVRLRLAPDSGDTPPKERPAPGGRPAGPGPPVTIQSLEIRGGRFRLEDGVALPGRWLNHTATNIDLTVSPILPGRTANFDLSLEEEGPEGLGPLEAHGTFRGLTGLATFENPLLVADVSIPALQVAGLQPFLASTAVIQRLSGQVGLAVHYTWDLGGRHSFDGTLDLGRAAYSDPALWDAPLPGTATTVSFRMNLDPDRLTFEKASVKRGALSVAASGILDGLGGSVVIRDALASVEGPVPELIAVFPWEALGTSGPKIRESLRTAEPIFPDRGRHLGLSARIEGFSDRPRVAGSLRGPLRVDSTASPAGAALFSRAGWEDVHGRADVDLAFAFEIARAKDARVRGRIALREFGGKPSGIPLRLEDLEADVAVTRESAEISRLSTIAALPGVSSDPARRVTVSLRGRVDEWSAQPAVTLRHLETSPISLRAASSLVPWEKTGASAGFLREILDAGGTLTIEEMAFPRTDLSSLTGDPVRLLPVAKAAVAISGVAVRPLPDFSAIEEMTGRASLDGGVVTATGIRGRAGPLLLPELSVQVSGLNARPRAVVRATGPLHVGEARNASARDLLRRHGLASLTGTADVDITVEGYVGGAEGWVGGGSLKLSGVRVVTYPAGVVVDGLQGRVTASRRAAVDVTAEEVGATIDGAPVRLSASLRGVGSPEFAVDAAVYTKGLDLARARELFPPLKPLDLSGRLEMDVNVSIPAAGTAPARLKGNVSAGSVGFRLPDPELAVTNGEIDVAMAGDAIDIVRTILQLNGQTIAVTGRIANPVEPDVRLTVTSPDLDLDRLLQPGGTLPAPRSPPPASGPADLPAPLRKLTASLSVEAVKGRFRGLSFHDLTLGATYDRGVLTACDLVLGAGGGRISVSGSADLRDPGKISFVLRPQVSSVGFDVLAPAFGIAGGPGSGPVTLTGEIRGRAGGAGELLPSLEGIVQVQAGPGRISKVGRFGALLARILSVASIDRGFLDGFSREGLAYKSTTAEGTFAGGGLDIGAFNLESGSLTLNAHGRIDFVRDSLDLKMKLGILGVVDKIIGAVPVVGSTAQSITSIPLHVEGPLDDPKVRLGRGRDPANP